MKNRIIISLIIIFMLSRNGYSQNDTLLSSKKHLTVGLTCNPFLAVIDKKQELGLSASFGYLINKRFETGFNWFTRQVIYAPDNAYKQLSNLKSNYNMESIYSIYMGVNFSEKKISHIISVTGGVRHDLYKETLINPQYEINQTFQSSEWNAVYGLGYTCKYYLSPKSAVSLRLFIPLNRHPFDDAIKYSLEPGFVFKL